MAVGRRHETSGSDTKDKKFIFHSNTLAGVSVFALVLQGPVHTGLCKENQMTPSGAAGWGIVVEP